MLYRGDGSTVFLRDRPMLVRNALDGAKLTSPLALASASDGSLFVGDYDSVKKVSPGGEFTKVLDLSGFTSTKAYRYKQAVDFYIGLPTSKELPDPKSTQPCCQTSTSTLYSCSKCFSS